MSADKIDEIFRLMSAFAREFGEFRKEVNARLDKLEGEMHAGFQAVRDDVRLMGRKMEILTQDVMDARTEVRDLGYRVTALENKAAEASD